MEKTIILKIQKNLRDENNVVVSRGVFQEISIPLKDIVAFIEFKNTVRNVNGSIKKVVKSYRVEFNDKDGNLESEKLHFCHDIATLKTAFVLKKKSTNVFKEWCRIKGKAYNTGWTSYVIKGFHNEIDQDNVVEFNLVDGTKKTLLPVVGAV